MATTSPPIPGRPDHLLRILEADDNPVLRAAVRGLLPHPGHPVAVVEDGREAIGSASREDLALVFLDVRMAGGDGLEAARALRLRHPGGRRARVVGLSAEGRRRESCSLGGMDDFLLEPVRLRDLEQALDFQPAP